MNLDKNVRSNSNALDICAKLLEFFKVRASFVGCIENGLIDEHTHLAKLSPLSVLKNLAQLKCRIFSTIGTS